MNKKRKEKEKGRKSRNGDFPGAPVVYDSELPVHVVWAVSLVRELSHMPPGMAKWPNDMAKNVKKNF